PRTLLLSFSIALALAACGGGADAPPPADTATDASAAAADTPRFTLDESALPPVNRFQASDLDTSVNACQDFNAYANGKWLASNDIPGDRTSWGSFEMLTERTLEVQRQLAEQAAADEDATGVEKIVGDFWATGMDRAAIDAQGIAPIQDVIDAIEALDSHQAVADYLRASAADGRNVLFGFGASPDFKDSAVNIAYASQGGLGLPDKTYYFDDNHADKLAAYEQHVARVLELSGVEAAEAAARAADVVAFETRLADKSRSRVELARDAELFYNPVSLEEADALTPNFPWTAFFDSQDVPAPEMFSLAMPEFHAEVDAMLADVP